MDKSDVTEDAQYAFCAYKGRVSLMVLLSRDMVDVCDEIFTSFEDTAVDIHGLQEYVCELLSEFGRYCFVNTDYMASLITDADIESIIDGRTREKMKDLFVMIYELKDLSWDLLALFDAEPEGILFYYNNGNEYKQNVQKIRGVVKRIHSELGKMSIIRLPFNHTWFTDGGQGVAESEKMVQIMSLIFAQCFGLLTSDRFHNAGIFCIF